MSSLVGTRGLVWVVASTRAASAIWSMAAKYSSFETLPSSWMQLGIFISFAIILSNLLVPMIEKITIPRAFGQVKEKKEGK